MAKEKILTIIKPDAVKDGHIGEIVSKYEKMDLKITGIILGSFSKAGAMEFYAEHEGKSFFEGLVEFMISGPVVLLFIEGDDAVRRNRNLIGCTDPLKAPKDSLRGLFGKGIPNNAVHGSDSIEAANREIRFFKGTPLS